jgi:hypothetical protein
MIVWDVALGGNIGANHGKSMVWPWIRPGFGGGWRISDASCGDWAVRASRFALHDLDRTALMWIEATLSDG